MESWWERAFLEFSLPHWAKEHVIQGHKTIFPLNQIILKSHFIKIHEVLGFFFFKKKQDKNNYLLSGHTDNKKSM